MIKEAPLFDAPPVRQQDSLGCQSNQLHKDLELNAGEFIFYRKCRQEAITSEVVTPPSNRGFLVGVSLTLGHHRQIFSGRRSVSRRFDKDSVYVRDFEDDYRADLHGSFDFILVELSRAFVSDAFYERSRVNHSGFSTLPDVRDPVLGHFALMLALLLDRKTDATPLFLEQLGVAISMHLIDKYTDASSESLKKNRRLSFLHETRAKDMLLAQSDGNVSLQEIADACNLSRSYFIRAFRETTDRTPHQWLLEKRIEQARDLLIRSDRTLSDVAIACGFSDQSHFTRTFSQMTGVPPGAWRRQATR